MVDTAIARQCGKCTWKRDLYLVNIFIFTRCKQERTQLTFTCSKSTVDTRWQFMRTLS